MDAQAIEVLKWVLLIIIAGLIAYFGCCLSKRLTGRFHRKRCKSIDRKYPPKKTRKRK